LRGVRFETTVRFGREAAFVSAGGYHHHIGLNTWESLGGSPPAPGTTGLYHLAILYPTRGELADALTRVIKAGITLDGASDHGVSEALYLRDPDQNGVELYWDRPHEQWPHSPDGRLTMFTRALDLDSLLAELNSKWWQLLFGPVKSSTSLRLGVEHFHSMYRAGGGFDHDRLARAKAIDDVEAIRSDPELDRRRAHWASSAKTV
jgi:catechol 2,3-dioxygenase